MTYQKFIKRASVSALLMFTIACESPPPYVLLEGEFNRDSQAFLNGKTDPDEVTICYAKDGTTPQNVSRLARDECALYGKKAVFNEQSYQKCPLVTPMAAVYVCQEIPNKFGFYETVK